MNPLTNVKNLAKLNERELALGFTGDGGKSWHQKYKDSAWIFFGGVPYDLTEGDLIAVFSQYGEIVNINLIRDHKSGKSKGFGFLCYEDQRSTILAVDNFNGIKLLGRIIRVDHVEEYKVPKLKDHIDEATKELWEQGCAPKPIEAPQLSDEELMPLDQDLPEIKTEVSDGTGTKKKKAKKEKKKKKDKKHKKKHKRPTSPGPAIDTDSDRNLYGKRLRVERDHSPPSSFPSMLGPGEIKRETRSYDRDGVPESVRRIEEASRLIVGSSRERRDGDSRRQHDHYTNKSPGDKYDEGRSFYGQKKEAEKYIQERYGGRRREESHYDQTEREFLRRYQGPVAQKWHF